jgi:uncharacterized protein (TIGR03086 family)
MLDLEPATRVLTDLVRGVRDDQLILPTPCAEAGLGDLLAHVDEFSVAFTAAATKTPTPGGGQRARPDASRLGTDWRTRIPGRLAALAAAWCEPAAWTGRTSVGGQDFPGEVTGVIALDEVVVHGWDIAAASGQQFRCEPHLLEAAVRVRPRSRGGEPAGGSRPVRTPRAGFAGRAAAGPADRTDGARPALADAPCRGLSR